MMTLYFAHNFNDRIKFRKLELLLEKELGIELFNPFYDEVTRTEEMNLIDNLNGDKKQHEWCIVNSKDLVRRDLKNLAKCDGLFTIISSPSIGTTLEIANATLMKKPVYVISPKYYDHPWIIEYATARFETLSEFKKIFPVFIKEKLEKSYE